jgi:hypothetical protein
MISYSINTIVCPSHWNNDTVMFMTKRDVRVCLSTQNTTRSSTGWYSCVQQNPRSLITCSLGCARCIQSTSSYPISLKSILIPSYLCLVLQTDMLPTKILHASLIYSLQILIYLSVIHLLVATTFGGKRSRWTIFPTTVQHSSSILSSRFDYVNNIWHPLKIRTVSKLNIDHQIQFMSHFVKEFSFIYTTHFTTVCHIP